MGSSGFGAGSAWGLEGFQVPGNWLKTFLGPAKPKSSPQPFTLLPHDHNKG